MFQRTDNLRRKIIAACIIGLGILTMGPCAVETYNNFSRNKERYNLAKSKVERLAEYDNVPGMSAYEWMSVYKMLGLEYNMNNPKKLSQKNLDDYLEKFGFFWNGKKYTDKIPVND